MPGLVSAGLNPLRCEVYPRNALELPDEDCPYIEYFVVDEGIVTVEDTLLTPAQHRAFILGAAGYTDEESGLLCGEPTDTIKMHLRDSFEIMGVRNKAQGVTDSFGYGDLAVRRPIKPRYRLTGRQLDILSLAAQGLGNTEIGDELDISPATVKVQSRRIRQRMTYPGNPRPRNWVAVVLKGYLSELLDVESIETSAA